MNGEISFFPRTLQRLNKSAPLCPTSSLSVRYIQASLALSLLFTATLGFAHDKLLLADYRQCPPEIIVDSKTGRGFAHC